MNKLDENNDLSVMTEIDRVVHEPARMAVLSLLYVVKNADFTFLMNQIGLTWGNLSAHMAKLETAGYIEVEKEFKGRRPNTILRLTEKGREAFRKYALQMKQVFGDFEG